MAQEMDVVGSLRKLSRELDQASFDAAYGNISLEALTNIVDGAAFLIKWIADGLERELELAFQRANNILGPRQLGQG